MSPFRIKGLGCPRPLRSRNAPLQSFSDPLKSQTFLTALPVYNEASHVDDVLERVLQYSDCVLVVDDGSTDGTAELLASRPEIHVERHTRNRGYGAALRTAFAFARKRQFDVLVTIDCDGQHQPLRIPQFVDACRSSDLVSGSRYLEPSTDDTEPPWQRRRINRQITARINKKLGLELTDAFCGFKAYRVASLDRLPTHENGYAMPLELWVQAARAGLRIIELPVPLIYLEENRSFGGELDDATTRLQHYHDVLDRSLARAQLTGQCCPDCCPDCCPGCCPDCCPGSFREKGAG